MDIGLDEGGLSKMTAEVIHMSKLYEQRFDEEKGWIVMGEGTLCGLEEVPEGHTAATRSGIEPDLVNCENCLRRMK